MSSYSEQDRERYAIFEKFYAAELEWAHLKIMDENEFTRHQYVLASLEGQIALLIRRQPTCKQLLGNYDNEFAKYSKEVETILEISNHERHQLKGYLFPKGRIDSLRKTMDELRKVRDENWNILDERTIKYITGVWWKLVTLRNDAETDKSQLFDRLENMAMTLEKHHSTVIELSQPKHEWVFVSSEKKRCAKCSKELIVVDERRHFSHEGQDKEKPVRDPDGYLPPS